MSSNNTNSENIHNASHSPMHLGIPGHDHFSYEDLQEFLGVMGDGQHHHHNHDPALLTSSTQDQPTAAMYDQTGHQTYGSEDGGGSTNTGSINNDSVAAGCGVSGNCNNGEPCEEAKAQARSERKRSREKQRRCDVNKQFANLTSVLQRIDSEEAAAARDEAEKQIASTTSSSAAVAMGRLAINPSNRVDLIGRTIHLLEHLHAANKRRKLEIDRLQEELELAKKAGEDTAMKLKEAMLAPPGEPMNKQIMMMVPMMMSSAGNGTTQAVPMMSPYGMGQGMPHTYCPMPQQMVATPVATAPDSTGPATAIPPAAGNNGAPAAQAAPAPVLASAPTAAEMAPASGTTQAATSSTHPASAPTAALQQQLAPGGYPFMMQAPGMPGGGFIMQMPAAHHGAMMMSGQHMTMVPQVMPQAPPHQQQQDSDMANHSNHHGGAPGHQEQKDSAPGMSNATGSNLAHCA